MKGGLIWCGGCLLVMAALVLGVRVISELIVIMALGYTALVTTLLSAWWSLAFITVVVVAALLWGRHPMLPSCGCFRRVWYGWLAALAVTVVVVAAHRPDYQPPGVLGVAAYPPHAAKWNDVDHPYRPKAWTVHNAHGFRDGEWSAQPREGVFRIVIVGDSYVYGKGVPEEHGLIDRQLERMLRERAPDRQWEVLNAGIPGWGFFTYFEVARRAMEALGADLVIVGSLDYSDWHLLDREQSRVALGEQGFRWLGAIGVVDDLHWISIRYSHETVPLGLGEWTVAGETELEADIRELLAVAEQRDARLMVWEYYDPFPFFRRFEEHPRFRVVGWPEGFPGGKDGWANDPRLAIPNDHHPTAEGNALVAEQLATAILSAR